jgi:S-DNA-T family DNA segregation ATPase FtsK/SpoIIIE
MATRTPTRPRAGATRSRSSSSRSGSRGSGRKPAARKPAARKSVRRSPAGGVILSSLGRGARALWLGIAHLVGWLARRIGNTARDLDPAHRRDGIGLALLGLATIVASVEWWGLRGGVGRVVHAVVAGTFGRVGLVVPLLLLGLGVRLLRHPEDADSGGRISIGLGALVLSTSGLVHIARGLPAPPDDDGRLLRDAGGYIGFLVSSPLQAAVTQWVAVPLLVLLFAFGLLVVTATPLHAVPERAKAAWIRLLHRTPPEATETDPDGLPVVEPLEPLKRHRPRRRVGALAGSDDTAEPYESPVVSTAASAGGDPVPATGSDEKPPPAHTPIPQRVEQLLLSGDITYSLPDSAILHEGSAHKARTKETISWSSR